MKADKALEANICDLTVANKLDFGECQGKEFIVVKCASTVRSSHIKQSTTYQKMRKFREKKDLYERCDAYLS